MKSIIYKIFLVLALLAIPLTAACSGTTEEEETGTAVYPPDLPGYHYLIHLPLDPRR